MTLDPTPLALARAAVAAALGPWQPGHGDMAGIDCPVCGGKGCLRYYRVAHTGEVWANCRTSGCVAWCEEGKG